MYPLGMILRLKTTGENVVVVGEGSDDEEIVQVRRPVNTTEGVKHVQEHYNLFELDTVEESVRREFNEVKIRQALIKGEEGARAEFVQ